MLRPVPGPTSHSQQALNLNLNAAYTPAPLPTSPLQPRPRTPHSGTSVALGIVMRPLNLEFSQQQGFWETQEEARERPLAREWEWEGRGFRGGCDCPSPPLGARVHPRPVCEKGLRKGIPRARASLWDMTKGASQGPEGGWIMRSNLGSFQKQRLRVFTDQLSLNSD